MKIGLVVACLLLFGAGAVLAQDDAPPAAAGRRGGGGPGGGEEGMRSFLGLGPMPDKAAALRGLPLYGANCGACHGQDARGGEGPDTNLLYSYNVMSDNGGNNITAVIKVGRGKMPAFAAKLTDAQIHDIAEYVDELAYDVANRGTYTYANVLVGDAAAGQGYYAKNCAQCHAITADLKGIAGKYPKPEDLQHAWVSPRGAADKLAFHQALLDTLSDQDMHNVTAYLETLK